MSLELKDDVGINTDRVKNDDSTAGGYEIYGLDLVESRT